MKMNQINLVKETFCLVNKIPNETIGELFYNRLFEIAPNIRPIFGFADATEQSRKLVATSSYIIKRLDNIDSITNEITRIVQHQVRFGVLEPRLYEPVGDAILWTLEQALGSNWNREVKTAWAICYIMLTNSLIEACEEVEVV
jgi:hemoglobin-like flavoprotein